jgi:hypothetical protein
VGLRGFLWVNWLFGFCNVWELNLGVLIGSITVKLSEFAGLAEWKAPSSNPFYASCAPFSFTLFDS